MTDYTCLKYRVQIALSKPTKLSFETSKSDQVASVGDEIPHLVAHAAARISDADFSPGRMGILLLGVCMSNQSDRFGRLQQVCNDTSLASIEYPFTFI